MSPPLLYRWKSFWLGILVLVFLGWSCVRTYATWETIDARVSEWRYLLVEGSGGMAFTSRYMSQSGPPRIERRKGGAWATLPPQAWPPIDFHWRTGSIYTFRIAHWLLILLFLVPWVCFLVWRVRRVKRLAAGSAEPPARIMVP